MASCRRTGKPGCAAHGSIARRHPLGCRASVEAAHQLEGDPSAFRPRDCKCRLLVANAQPQVHRCRLYFAEIRSDRMPAFVAAVDTSGSTESVLPVFKAELLAIVEECQPEATIVIMADADVQRVDRFEAGEPVEFNVEGLGGTDFRPVFMYLEQEQLEAACVIYLTDGYGVFPETPCGGSYLVGP